MLLNLCFFFFLQVKAQNDFRDEMFQSTWHYAKDIVNKQQVTGTTTGYHNYEFHETDDRSQVSQNLQFCHKSQ